jgi:hypothetical protein
MRRKVLHALQNRLTLNPQDVRAISAEAHKRNTIFLNDSCPVRSLSHGYGQRGLHLDFDPDTSPFAIGSELVSFGPIYRDPPPYGTLGSFPTLELDDQRQHAILTAGHVLDDTGDHVCVRRRLRTRHAYHAQSSSQIRALAFLSSLPTRKSSYQPLPGRELPGDSGSLVFTTVGSQIVPLGVHIASREGTSISCLLSSWTREIGIRLDIDLCFCPFPCESSLMGFNVVA